MMEMDQEPEDDASPTELSASAMNAGFGVRESHEASRARTLGSSGNGLSSAGASNHMPSAITEQDARLGLEMKFPNLDLVKVRKPVKYRECLKNHAASLGGHALDGCGEFMPSGSEGTLEALKCAACDCHRNFHRREVEGEKDHRMKRLGPQLLPAPSLVPPPPPPMALMPAPAAHQHVTSQVIMALGGPRSAADFDDPEGGSLLSSHPSLHSSAVMLRKRFRTKFTSEQKEKMWDFAEKLGWRIQKHDEQAVQQFCADVGVKRHVLKVWMHNNKNTLGKKPSS